MIHTKSADDPIAKKDGLRIFVTRFWPRGHGRDECDEWIPSLAPSERLLRSFQKGAISWAEFSRQYNEEMLRGYADESRDNPRMKNSGQKYFLRFLKRLAKERDITLICSCAPDAKQCHRHLLRKLLVE